LLDVASRTISTGGEQALTVRSVAAAAGTSASAVYALFGSREDLLAAVSAEGFRRFAAHLAAVPRTQDPVADLRQLGRAYRASALADPHFYRVMFDRAVAPEPPSHADGRPEPVERPTFRVLHGAVSRILAGRDRTAQDATRPEQEGPGKGAPERNGTAGELDRRAETAALALWGLVHGLVSLELAGLLPGDDAARAARYDAAAGAVGPALLSTAGPRPPPRARPARAPRAGLAAGRGCGLAAGRGAGLAAGRRAGRWRGLGRSRHGLRIRARLYGVHKRTNRSPARTLRGTCPFLRTGEAVPCRVEGMALMQRLRRLIHGPTSASSVGERHPSPSAPRRGDTIHEDALRAQLADDPNNIEAFSALAEIVRRHAAEGPGEQDPLRDTEDEPTVAEQRSQAEDLAVWALAEEIGGNPRGWYPLLELGRLSLAEDPEGAVRRFTTAAERDPEGRALAEGLAILRDAGMPVEALGLGVGHWRVREHTPEVARHLVRAALEADRPFEAKQHLRSLAMYPNGDEVARLTEELEQEIAESERGAAGT
jgi:AcrR family transcriptional regulator